MVLKDSLIELMRHKPVNKITIKEICENADVNRTTFYAYYSDQYRLLKSIEDETLSWVKDTVAAFSGSMEKADFYRNIEKVFIYIAENKNHIQVLMSEQGDIAFQRDLLSVIYEQCGIWLAGSFDTDPSRNMLHFIFLVNGSVGIIQHWLKTGLSETPGQMSEIICSLALRS
jgi:AcrR family transcriptional regulator